MQIQRLDLPADGAVSADVERGGGLRELPWRTGEEERAVERNDPVGKGGEESGRVRRQAEERVGERGVRRSVDRTGGGGEESSGISRVSDKSFE